MASPQPDRLQELAAGYRKAHRSGVLEGVSLAISMFRSASKTPADKPAAGERGLTNEMVKRYGFKAVLEEWAIRGLQVRT